MLASCTYFSVASDGSTDTAQLLLNVPAVNSNFEITQELTGLASLQGCTTGLDIFYFRFLVHASLAKVRIIILSAALPPWCALKKYTWPKRLCTSDLGNALDVSNAFETTFNTYDVINIRTSDSQSSDHTVATGPVFSVIGCIPHTMTYLLISTFKAEFFPPLRPWTSWTCLVQMAPEFGEQSYHGRPQAGARGICFSKIFINIL